MGRCIRQVTFFGLKIGPARGNPAYFEENHTLPKKVTLFLTKTTSCRKKVPYF